MITTGQISLSHTLMVRLSSLTTFHGSTKTILPRPFKDIRFHDLRHTAASLMLMEGEELKTVSQILGHSTIAITADIYIHIVEAQKRTALNRLEKYMTSN